jgi:hypothetical protein
MSYYKGHICIDNMYIILLCLINNYLYDIFNIHTD